MRRKSIIWALSREKLVDLVNRHNNLNEILVELGFRHASGGGHSVLARRLKEECIDLTALYARTKAARSQRTTAKTRIPFDHFFVKGVYRNTTSAKLRLLAKGLIKEECSKCHVGTEWQGQRLALQLDHINGENTDNRVENLRLLCPNCHSQTETWSGGVKRLDRTKRKLSKEVLEHLLESNTLEKTAEITRTSYETVCKLIKHYGIAYVKKKVASDVAARLFAHTCKFEVEALELSQLVETMPMTEIGKKFGVSDNAIRKRCKKLGVAVPRGRVGGYWHTSENKAARLAQLARAQS